MAYLSRTLEKVIKLNSSPIKRSWWAASYLTRWINGACYWHFYYCHFFYFSVKNDSYSKLCLCTSMIICFLHSGTFSARSAAESEADCEACYPGSYCPSWAQTSADLLCPPGWFCPAGSASGHQPGGVHITAGQLRLNSGLCTFM